MNTGLVRHVRRSNQYIVIEKRAGLASHSEGKLKAVSGLLINSNFDIDSSVLHSGAGSLYGSQSESDDEEQEMYC